MACFPRVRRRAGPRRDLALAPGEADETLSALHHKLIWEQREIVFFGRPILPGRSPAHCQWWSSSEFEAVRPTRLAERGHDLPRQQLDLAQDPAVGMPGVKRRKMTWVMPHWWT
ncbi:MAG TPA: hypothetical protein VHO73_09615 [Methylomirabilota bacterium]|jgi:hypothetical protein|nr:hypothetical protein [Methylomirabilota bacterium]